MSDYAAIVSTLGCYLDNLLFHLQYKTKITTEHEKSIFFQAIEPKTSMTEWLSFISAKVNCSAECMVRAVVLVQRINIFCRKTAHRLLFTAIMCCAKCVDDVYYDNKSFALLIREKTKLVNNFEAEFLPLCEFDLAFSAQVYYKEFQFLMDSKHHQHCVCLRSVVQPLPFLEDLKEPEYFYVLPNSCQPQTNSIPVQPAPLPVIEQKITSIIEEIKSLSFIPVNKQPVSQQIITGDVVPMEIDSEEIPKRNKDSDTTVCKFENIFTDNQFLRIVF